MFASFCVQGHACSIQVFWTFLSLTEALHPRILLREGPFKLHSERPQQSGRIMVLGTRLLAHLLSKSQPLQILNSEGGSLD